MQNKKWYSSLLVSATLLSFTGIASAHVTVSPTQSTTRAYEKYTFRMPVEKDINTTGLRIEFPAGERVSTVEPVPGWSYIFENDANGNAKSITWKATAGGIKPHEFMEFSIVGANPKDAGTLTWKAYQTYADGSVVEWTGEPGSKTPAPVTSVKQGTAGGDHHHEDAGTTTNAPNSASGSTQTTPVSNSNTTWPLVLSGIAILLSLVSFFRKKA